MLPLIITRLVGWAVSLFFKVERMGPSTPGGPVLVAANHPNALVDPLVIFRTAGRPTRPLAKAPLFEHVLLGTVLRGLGGLPVYRRQDDPGLMRLNDRTFDAAIGALEAGGAVQIYPEGTSHSDPSLAPLRTGAARIALQAEARASWRLGLHVQVVGLTYARKHAFRGRVVAAFDEPFDVLWLRDLYERDPREATRVLTARVKERLEALTLNFDDPGDPELVDVAERLYSRQKEMAHWRRSAPLSDRLPRLRRFADGVRWLQANDPEALQELRSKVRRYWMVGSLLGSVRGGVPPRYRVKRVVPYILGRMAFLGVLAPIAAAGWAGWWIPTFAVRRVVRRFRPELDQLATMLLGAALIAFPVWWSGAVAVAWWLSGAPAALAVGVGLPVVGLGTVAWGERFSAFREDVRVFWRVRGRGRGVARLDALRRELVAAFDRVGRRLPSPP